jgi:hypothetical protein
MNFIAACLLVPVFVLVPPQPPEDGFYLVADAGLTVKTIAGEDIRIAEKIEERLTRAVVRSISNSNQRYAVRLEKDTAFIAAGRTALCVRGHCVRFTFWGQSPGRFSTDAEIPAATAEQFAVFLGVPVEDRTHPGHALRTRFVPARDSFSINDALPVEVEVTNVGMVPVTFQVGGQQRGFRDNQFGFTAYGGPNRAVADTGDPTHTGGLSSNRTLQPGQTFTLGVDLRSWFTFPGPGVYRIVGTYELRFFPPGEVRELWWPLWDDFATASFTVTIE